MIVQWASLTPILQPVVEAEAAVETPAAVEAEEPALEEEKKDEETEKEATAKKPGFFARLVSRLRKKKEVKVEEEEVKEDEPVSGQT